MKSIETNWTKNEFKAYLLLYAANADYIITDTEKDIIDDLVDVKQYHKIYAELENDSDFQSIEKILFNLKKFNYSKNEIDVLLTEIKALFLSDGKYDQLEKIMYKSFKKIFNPQQ